MDDITLVSGNGDKEPQFPPLPGQGPNYNLTMDCNDVQGNLADISKPLNTSIGHLDEFLKNVISVDQEGQLVQHPSSSSLPTSLFLGNFNLNGPLMVGSKKKTMDDVWKEIVHPDHHSLSLNSAAGHESLHHQGMTTIGEPTETSPPGHLLVRADILNTHAMMPIDPEAVVSQQADWFQFQVSAAAQQMTMLDSNFKVCESVFENSSSAMNLDNFSENHQVGMSSIPMPAISAAASSESQATHAERKRNYSDEMKEKTIERRQKRMIKNRESAARSRARKQAILNLTAYTNQLENEVFHFRKMNTWLKKQKEVEILLSSNPTNSMPTYQLRRTSSASF